MYLLLDRVKKESQVRITKEAQTRLGGEGRLEEDRVTKKIPHISASPARQAQET